MWIQSQLESYGYEVSTHDFTHFDFTGTNYFVTKPGKSDKTIIIGAHYDSMPTAGVDDNGSGVSVLLELAYRVYDMEEVYKRQDQNRVLQEPPLPHPVHTNLKCCFQEHGPSETPFKDNTASLHQCAQSPCELQSTDQ